MARTLAKGMEVLSAFRDGLLALGNSELAARTGIPRPTVARLSKTLSELGYLAYDPVRAKYRLAAGVLKLGHPLLAGMPVRQAARPLMQDLANALSCSVSIGVASGIDLVYVETARSMQAIGPHVPDIGSSIPLPQAALGRALWSMLSTRETRALTAQIQRDAPDIWKGFGAKLDSGARDCAERGFCVAYGDWVEDVHAAATPLFTDRETGVAYALNCGLQSFRLAPGQLVEEIGPRLVALAGAIRTACGTAPRAENGARTGGREKT